MKKQRLNVDEAAIGLPGPQEGSAPGVERSAVLAFPGAGASGAVDDGVLSARIQTALRSMRRGPATVIPGERVSLMRLALPVRGARQRLRAAPFALEDRLAQPLEELHVALTGSGAEALAAVIGQAEMAAAVKPGRPVLSECMAIPVPEVPQDALAAWAVWRDGLRAVVRVSDGTGFAVRADMLADLWRSAGRPTLTSLGAALPQGLPNTDHSSAPPPPDPRDLRFDLRQGAFAPGAAARGRALIAAAGIVAVGLALHLGLALADRAALSRLAETARTEAQAALDATGHGLRVEMGMAAILPRLAPAGPERVDGAFLHLVSQVSAVLLAEAPRISARRMTWDVRSGRLTMLVTAEGLDALQQVERALVQAGLSVSSGVATAGAEGAQAELRIEEARG